MSLSNMNYKIKHLQLFLEGKFDLIPKSLGVELVELGILNYSKLTPENYEYWWYEVDDKSKIDKNKFTFNWSDLIPTRKIEMVKDFIQYYKEDESMYKLITAILNMKNVDLKNETPTFGNVLLGECAVNLVSMFGYWHLHRVLNEKHYFGFSDHRIGLSIRTETADKVKDWTRREFKIWQSFTTKEGKLIEYWDEPYTESQIATFGNLTLEKLERWVERGT